MKYLFTLVILTSYVISMTGCVCYPRSGRDLLGTGHADIEEARANGITKEFSMSPTDAFNKVIASLTASDITIYQSNMEKGYIIAMNFPKQTNTTRVGVFFESTKDDKTNITLSSLSSTALAKADLIVFGSLEAGK